MFWIVALLLILIGLYLIVSGIRESFFEVEKSEERFRKFEDIYPRHREWDKEWEEEAVKGKKKVTGGGVILIGPVPIVFGESRFAVLALILTITLILLSIFMLFSFY